MLKNERQDVMKLELGIRQHLSVHRIEQNRPHPLADGGAARFASGQNVIPQFLQVRGQEALLRRFAAPFRAFQSDKQAQDTLPLAQVGAMVS